MNKKKIQNKILLRYQKLFEVKHEVFKYICYQKIVFKLEL